MKRSRRRLDLAGWLALVAGFGGGWGALPITAQDVLVNSPTWLEEKDAPDKLPALKSAQSLEFPAELKTTPEIGYVVYQLLLDPKGKILGLKPQATLAAYGRAVQLSASAWNPGRRDGKGVNTATEFSVIFNPASAAVKKTAATPRLLEVSLVRIDRPRGVQTTITIPDRVEAADVTVDEQGAVTAVRNAPAGLGEAFSVATKNWRFAPARREGKAVVADVRMSFIVTMRDEESIGVGKRTSPRVQVQEAPRYPFAMRANGMRGEVLVDFIVDIEGRVRRAFVVRSLNPAFDDPALDAVNKWRFEPGFVGDRPVNTHMQVPIIFMLDNAGQGGDGPLSAPSKSDLSKLPEQFRYDTPPRPVGTVRPVYPYALLRARKEGKSVVRFVVDAKGRVVQTDIGESTVPEMGRALQAAVECFVYEPAIKAGRPSPSIQGFAQQFTRDETWQLVSYDDLALLRREEKNPTSILLPSELDTKLTATSRRPPQFPLDVKEGVKGGETLIEILVDEEGRARLPRILSASDEAFGYAAVQGVAAWRFDPPKRGGRPVVVRVQIPFSFGGAATPAPSGKQ